MSSSYADINVVNLLAVCLRMSRSTDHFQFHSLSEALQISIKIDPSQKAKSETLIVEIISQWSLLISRQSGRME